MKRRSIHRLFTVSVALLALSVSSGVTLAGTKNRKPSIWSKTTESNIHSRGQRQLFPQRYVTFSLNDDELKNTMAEMPREFSADSRMRSVIMSFPMPDGSMMRFRVEDSPILADHLAGAFPGWKTFQGYGVDDPTASGRFDWTSKGFHGYVFTSKGIVYIDPYAEGDTQNYLVYYKHEFGRNPDDAFACRTKDSIDGLFGFASLVPETQTYPAEFANGTNIRTYRLAIATSGEWARGTAMGSTDPQTVRTAALAALTTSVNRLDGIYRIELSVTLQLVNPPITNNATNVIFDDPATDPFDNTDAEAQLAINQTTLDNRVGAANYDVGHLFGTGGGGVASTPSVCSTQKAEGYSARAGFYGDPFTVDYVAHELGHQFGSNHTYNNSDPNGACTTRSGTNAYEVASGSTIMSYVGICNQRNLQQYVDTVIPTFHMRSLTVILAYLQTGEGNTCGTAGVNSNAIPTVNAGASFTIPRLTPFTLTATGGDADAADVPNLLYSWEEYDLAPSASGATGAPAQTYDVDTDGILRPLFRAYSPVASNSRTFPSLTFILNPATNNPAGSNNPALTYLGNHPTGASGAVCEPMVTCVTGENLPSVTRTMNFRVAVRDRRGGIQDAGTTVNVVAAAGPFRVTAQDAAPVTWAGNSQQTVTWDVAGTTANGINTANVKISLSTDGGQTFPIVLAVSSPNDGTQAVTIPNNATTQARIKVEGVGNIFFDINNVNFTITASAITRTVRADFDADGRSDLSVYRPGTGTWYLQRSTAGFSATNFGVATDVIAPADYDGDHKADLSVWRPNNTDGLPDFYILRSADNTLLGASWGTTADIPVVADYDGDGKSDLAVWRAATGYFYVLQSQTGTIKALPFGTNGDKPVPGDFDGDNKADYSVFRPSTGTWYIIRSTDVGLSTISWGTAGDIPVYADYDGDLKDDVAVFRPADGNWYILKSTGGTTALHFGANGDVPAPGDFDGDGKYDQAVFRAGTWYLNNSTSGFGAASFGIAGDIATPRNYLPQ